MRRGARTLSAMLVLALLAAACTGGDEKASQTENEDTLASGPPFAPDGPLIGVVMASAIDDSAQPVNPGLVFSSTDEQVTAIVYVGDIAPRTTLTIAWRQWVGPETREPLFEHRIEAMPFQKAYSVGVSEGLLQEGIYEVVVTLGDHQIWSPWIVQESSAGASLFAVAATGRALAFALQQEAEPQPPAPGESGTASPSEDEVDDGFEGDEDERGEIETSAGCFIDTSGFFLIMVLEAYASASGRPGECGQEFVLAASVEGGPREELTRFQLASDSRHASGYATTHPCFLPGGNDDPGTVIDLEAWEVGKEDEVAHGTVTIHDLGGPFAGIAGQPGPGARVRPGQRIRLYVLIVQLPTPGIESAELKGPEGVFASEEYEPGESCDPAHNIKVLRGTYRVPDDPPPIITLQATATDRLGRKGTSTVQYFTVGEIWSGTMTSLAVDEHIPGCLSRERIQMALNLAVSPSGTVVGNAKATSLSGHSNLKCPGEVVPYPPTQARFEVGGTKTEEGFDIWFTPTRGTMGIGFLTSFMQANPERSISQHIPLTSPTRAVGTDTATYVGDAYHSTNKFRLRCKICD